ncbi:membrane protein [Halostagnicola sp. A56]|uniref:DUF2243 domain-containing protein n=1 Tax=Halostagnicola sp. A56 TaxID=1495067 RepID=UPI00049F3A19|nr:DUF2243 domain-containing protein [Halostagnicola sp. A56]KDE58208.1 membrane protein [Halostagnicola sp. A56]
MSDQAGAWMGLPERVKPLVTAGAVLGLGLGGFFDGIVIHQILQWHHMVSSHANPAVAGNLELNVMADGFFHVGTYVFTVLGIVLLWRAWGRPGVPKSGRALFGSVILGWGLFNVIEGLVNHHLLGIHHVWPAGPGSVLLWDLGFLLWGGLFIVVGYAVVRRGTGVQSLERTPAEAGQGE